MFNDDFIKARACWINPAHVACLVWQRDTVQLYLAGCPQPVSVPRQDFVDGLSLHYALHGSPPPRRAPSRAGVRLSVVPEEGEDAG